MALEMPVLDYPENRFFGDELYQSLLTKAFLSFKVAFPCTISSGIFGVRFSVYQLALAVPQYELATDKPGIQFAKMHCKNAI